MNSSVGGKYWVLRKINNLSLSLCSQCLGLLDTHSDQNYCLVQQIQRGASATSSQSESETGVVINQLNISAYHLWTSLLAWTLLMFSYFSSCPVSGVSGVSHESFKSLGAEQIFGHLKWAQASSLQICDWGVSWPMRSQDWCFPTNQERRVVTGSRV